MLSCCETAGYVRFALFTSGYGYSPPSATLALCPVLQQAARVFTPLSSGEGLEVGLFILGAGGRGAETLYYYVLGSENWR